MLVFLGQILPQPLRPIFGMLLALPLKYHRWSSIRRLRPVFKDRLELLRKTETLADELPQDIITWTSKVALESNMIEAQDPAIVARQFIESVFTTAEAAIAIGANFFLDILSTESHDICQQLRQEAQSIFPTGGLPQILSLKKLALTDSALRETLRRNTFSIYGLFHEVIPKDRVITPDGHHLPRGTCVCVPTMGIHHDDRLYKDPERYNPYRFLSDTDYGRKASLIAVSERFKSRGCMPSIGGASG